MPEVLPDGGSTEEAGNSSTSREGTHQQSSGGSLKSAAYQTLPQHNREYLQASYWNERFKHEVAYEWYANYRQAGAGAVTGRHTASSLEGLGSLQGHPVCSRSFVLSEH